MTPSSFLFVPDGWPPEDFPMVAAIPGRAATVRGSIRWSKRRRPLLVPGGNALVRGRIIPADAALLALLDLVHGAGSTVSRVTVRASAGLRPVDAEAYVADRGRP